MRNLLLTAAFTALASTALASTAAAHDFRLGDLVIAHPFAFATPETARAGGGYMSITNNGAAADRLIAIEADFPMVQLHTTEEEDGVARMTALETVEIAPGETVTFGPGGMHVMFMGLEGPFIEGAEIPAVLVFEQAGAVDVVFNVEARGAETGDADAAPHAH